MDFLGELFFVMNLKGGIGRFGNIWESFWWDWVSKAGSKNLRNHLNTHRIHRTIQSSHANFYFKNSLHNIKIHSGKLEVKVNHIFFYYCLLFYVIQSWMASEKWKITLFAGKWWKFNFLLLYSDYVRVFLNYWNFKFILGKIWDFGGFSSSSMLDLVWFRLLNQDFQKNQISLKKLADWEFDEKILPLTNHHKISRIFKFRLKIFDEIFEIQQNSFQVFLK